MFLLVEVCRGGQVVGRPRCRRALHSLELGNVRCLWISSRTRASSSCGSAASVRDSNCTRNRPPGTMALGVAAHGHPLVLRTTNMLDSRDGGHSVVGPTHLSLVPFLGKAAGGIMLESLFLVLMNASAKAGLVEAPGEAQHSREQKKGPKTTNPPRIRIKRGWLA
ncbi:uncharacterized protein LY79DRAFT_207894 [Colletotrichum navitas]|uniref:Uncharacterized protein n=1 Tax=Colletotrichum navitas TaxID=681940 RepID=A0AAD8VBK6_9PEZI|nr:uncharacterized protein LY79DRAFT_207894 [Colletotrichum navitas]KAK1599091.1 hypothetical protein LY79DRAFT_207894 [Colletotrichum navitas]